MQLDLVARAEPHNDHDAADRSEMTHNDCLSEPTISAAEIQGLARLFRTLASWSIDSERDSQQGKNDA
jgi:hypothetical protein